jgi:hypothetical protein
MEAIMAFAPYINAHRRADQGEVLGCFREKDHGLTFEYAKRTDALFPDDFRPEFPHVVFVGHGEVRLAKVLKTVLTMLVDEDWIDKWHIRSHREY